MNFSVFGGMALLWVLPTLPVACGERLKQGEHRSLPAMGLLGKWQHHNKEELGWRPVAKWFGDETGRVGRSKQLKEPFLSDIY